MNRRNLIASVVVTILATSSARTQPPTGGQPPAEEKQIKIIALVNTPAEEAQDVLRQILDEPNTDRGHGNPYGAPRLSSPPVQMAVHESTNSLILRASADRLAIAEAIVQRLDEQGTGNNQADNYTDLRNRVSRLENKLRALTARQSSSRAVPATQSKPAIKPEWATPPTDAQPKPATKSESAKQSAEAEPKPNASGRQTTVADNAAPRLADPRLSRSRAVAGTRIAAQVNPGKKPMRIKRIVTPGTRVKKDDLLVELEITDLQEVIDAQCVPLEESKSQLAQLEADIEQADAEGRMVEAELQQRVELSELALTTYRKATAEIEIQRLESEVAKATETVTTMEKAAERMKDKPIPQLNEAKRQLQLAKLRHSSMVDIQVPAEITRLEGERKLAALALQLVQDKMANEMKRLNAQRSALSINIKLQEDKLAQLLELKGGSFIKAPHDGIVDPDGSLLNIEPGAVVRENQSLLLLTPEKNLKH
jgi:hypothetical protein